MLAHPAPPFTLDSDEPMTPERAGHFRALAALLRRAEAREALRPAADPPASPRDLRVLSLAGARTVALWLHAPRGGYGEPVRGATVSLPDLAPGRWSVTWLDDVTGAELARGEVPPGAVLAVPPFARHVAALVERVDGSSSPVDAPAPARPARRSSRDPLEPPGRRSGNATATSMPGAGGACGPAERRHAVNRS